MVAGLHDDRALASVRRNRQHSTQFAAAAGRAPIGSVVSAGCSWRWRPPRPTGANCQGSWLVYWHLGSTLLNLEAQTCRNQYDALAYFISWCGLGPVASGICAC